MQISQYIHFFGIVLHSFLLALTLGTLSRWFPNFGNAMQFISAAVVVCFFGAGLMIRKSEFTTLIFFGLFVLGFGGGLAWL
jgi:hypothetical protein